MPVRALLIVLCLLVSPALGQAPESITVRELHVAWQERNRAVELQFEGQKVALAAALNAAEKAVNAALAAAKEAVEKAERAAQVKFELLNEIRGALTDQQRLFATRLEINARMDSLADKIAAIERVQNTTAGRSEGVSSLWLVAVGLVSVIGTIVSVFVAVRRPPAIPPAYVLAPPRN